MFATDGKNLAIAYMGTLVGSFDLNASMDESSDAGEEEVDTPTIFSALDPFLDKGGAIATGNVQQWYPPAAGLDAITETLRRLRSPEGATIVADEDVREGCIFDLETYAKMLKEAQSHGAQFVFSFEA